MQAYPEVPQWWYVVIGVLASILLCVSIEIFSTELPIWAAIFAILLAVLLSIPLAMIQAMTNQELGLQVMHELMAGCVLPGRPVTNMIFKTIALIETGQAVSFAGGLKLGHYMKIPPRMMFMVQVVAAFISCFVVTLVQEWMFGNIVDLCASNQKNGFTCHGTNAFATGSLIWGGIGPRRLFSPGAM